MAPSWATNDVQGIRVQDTRKGGIDARFRLEGWSAATVDGRDHDAIEAAVTADQQDRPHVVVAEVERRG